MKHTTNYIIYLNSDNTVYSARCKITGRFVKRDLAQNEYELEYVYKVTFKGFISFMFTVFLAYKIEQLNNEIFYHFNRTNLVK